MSCHHLDEPHKMAAEASTSFLKWILHHKNTCTFKYGFHYGFEFLATLSTITSAAHRPPCDGWIFSLTGSGLWSLVRISPLTGNLPQWERSKVKGNRSKPEHEWLNPSVAPGWPACLQNELCAGISGRFNALPNGPAGVKKRVSDHGRHSTVESSEMWPCRTSVWGGGDLCCTGNWHKVPMDDEKNSTVKISGDKDTWKVLAYVQLVEVYL